MSNNTGITHRGFSLVELLIVVVIIGILAAIAIPNLIASRRSANEGSAISDMRMYFSAQSTYASSVGMGSYAGNPGSAVNTEAFFQLGAAGIIDSLLAGGLKSSYLFTGGKVDQSSAGPASFCGRAVPIVGDGLFATGPRNIAVSTDGVLYGGPAADVDNAGCSIVDGSMRVTAASPLSN